MKLLPPVPFRRKRGAEQESVSPESYRLDLRPRDFFNHLLQFDRLRLVIRAQGLTLCRETEFGHFFSERDRCADPVSGLSVAPDLVTGIYLHHDQAAPPSFEIAFRDIGFACAIHPDPGSPARRITKAIVASFAVVRESSGNLRTSGAARWLDQSLHLPGERPRTFSRLLETDAPGEFQIDILASAFGFTGTFSPGRTDREGSTLKLSDRAGGTVVHADPGSPAVKLPAALAPDAIRPCQVPDLTLSSPRPNPVLSVTQPC